MLLYSDSWDLKASEQRVVGRVFVVKIMKFENAHTHWNVITSQLKFFMMDTDGHSVRSNKSKQWTFQNSLYSNPIKSHDF